MNMGGEEKKERKKDKNEISGEERKICREEP
jgi:hypothetical protein